MNFRVSSRRSCSWPAESLSCSAAWVWSSWTGSTMLPVRAMVTKRQTVSDRRVTGRVCSAALLLSSPSLFLFTLLQPQTKIDKPCSSSSSEQRTYIPFWENVLNSVQYAVRPQRWCFILYFCCHDMFFFFYIYIYYVLLFQSWSFRHWSRDWSQCTVFNNTTSQCTVFNDSQPKPRTLVTHPNIKYPSIRLLFLPLPKKKKQPTRSYWFVYWKALNNRNICERRQFKLYYSASIVLVTMSFWLYYISQHLRLFFSSFFFIKTCVDFTNEQSCYL